MKRILLMVVVTMMATLNLSAQCKEKGDCCCGVRHQFVTLTDVVPVVILEIRYYGTYNFGERIDGYLAPIALLTKQAVDSLKAVSDDLVKMGYRLRIYDAYRPQRAVDHFVRWAANVPDVRMKQYILS